MRFLSIFIILFPLLLSTTPIYSEDSGKKVVKEQTGEQFPMIFQSNIQCKPIGDIEKEKGIFDKGLFWAFLFVFVGGFLTSLTPCAFPVILVSMPSLMKKEGSKPYKFLISFTYVLGIATMYSSLGVVTASTGKAFGTLMQNPWVIGGFIIFFIAMALSSLGAFILQLPSGIATKMNEAGTGSGFIKAYISGLFLGILAAPCVGPVLAGVLAYIAQTGNILLGFLLLTVFAFGMGVLIIVIGTFSPNWSSGAWMEKVNTIFGILLFFAALYFLKDMFGGVILTPFDNLYETVGFSTPIFLAIAVAIGVIGYFVGPFKFEEMFMISFVEKLRKGFGALIISISLFMIAGVFLYIKGESKVEWVHTEPEGIKLAKQHGKSVMIDFGATWCAACKELEKHTFPNDKVSEILKERFISVHLDCTETEDSETCSVPNDKYGVNYQLPTVIFIDSCGRLRKDLTLKGFESAEDFIKRLNKVQ